ncbi:MAG: hypothetical protein GEV07_28720 [Streptosporangiales bacterium]|nr:hypothetical protein [Streptosporangiales bacterium]
MRLPWQRSAQLPAQASVDAGYAAPSSSSAAAVRTANEQLRSITQPTSGGAYGYLGLRSPAQAAEVLSGLTQLAEALEPALSQVDRYLRREEHSGRLESVDGPFAGDATAAVGTTHMWLSEAAVAAEKLSQALENAQIATGGLARPTDRSRQ